MSGELVIRIPHKDIAHSRTNCLFDCNVRIHECYHQLAQKLSGRVITVGSCRGAVQSCENGTVTLRNESSGAEVQVPLFRAVQALEGETSR